MTKYPPRHAASNANKTRRASSDRNLTPATYDRVAYAAALEVLG